MNPPPASMNPPPASMNPPPVSTTRHDTHGAVWYGIHVLSRDSGGGGRLKELGDGGRSMATSGLLRRL
eukprot:672712-Prorocentrum_minimum.AAC.1